MTFGFSKKESIFVFVTVCTLIAATLINLSVSYRKSRDNERKNSLGDIVKRVGDFQKATGSFPLSTDDGKIIGCDGFQDKFGRWFYKPCEWGPNKLNSPHFDPLPVDPYSEKGWHFVYYSNGETFQLYVTLEGRSEDEFDSKIVARNISCGEEPCNAGRTNGVVTDLYAALPAKK